MAARTGMTLLAAALVAATVAAPAATSLPLVARAAAADCNGAAQRVVAQTGGQLLSASAVQQNGRTVCQITVLVQESGNDRPRKRTVTVPQ